MLIKVTEEDIAKGVRCSIHKCPLALAIRRTFLEKGLQNIVVSASVLEYHSFKFITALPDKAAEFRQRFDNGKEVKPFTFELEV